MMWLQKRPSVSRAECGGGCFSIARYEPMMRLAAEEDFEFLASLPGYRPRIGATLRRERRRIFRMYLGELAHDFRYLHAEARKIVADSPEQHADLVSALIRQKLQFWAAMAVIDARLLLHAVRLPQIDVRGLIDAVEAMRLNVAQLSAAAA